MTRPNLILSRTAAATIPPGLTAFCNHRGLDSSEIALAGLFINQDISSNNFFLMLDDLSGVLAHIATVEEQAKAMLDYLVERSKQW